MNANEFRQSLTELLSARGDILGIAQTGDLNAPLIPGRSDIDLFVLCSEVPDRETRAAMYRSLTDYESLTMEVCGGGIWGYGDIFMVGGIDVMPMYFTAEEMRRYAQEVLDGRHLQKDGRFYPIGRLASIESINVLWERDSAWSGIIDLVKAHPQSLFDRWFAQESSRMIDAEDLGRAALRHEVLFYHQVAEEFLDHFLQALYAKNNCYFPSRKRTEAAIAGFALKPRDCYRRLTEMVRLGSCEDTIEASIAELRRLAQELMSL